MAIKNLFGRGIGFGEAHWIVTRGYSSGTPVVSIDPPSPHLLATVDFVANVLAVETVVQTLLGYEPVSTTFTWIAEDGTEMATPLIFSRTETGPVTLKLTGADGTPEDLSTAASATLTVATLSGTKIVNAVALTSLTSAGTGVWTRQSSETATAGDYWAQVKVVRADSSIGQYPNSQPQPGFPVTILRLVGD